MERPLASGSLAVSGQLDILLKDLPYLTGYSPTSLDRDFAASQPEPSEQFPNLLRWHRHIHSFSAAEQKDFPTTDKTIEEIVAMSAGSELSPAEKKALITRNLQETLGEDRIEYDKTKPSASKIFHSLIIIISTGGYLQIILCGQGRIAGVKINPSC